MPIHERNNLDVNQWWLKGGVNPSECLAAFQPIGASGITQSLFNINSRGSNDAVVGTTPTHSKKQGWTFDGATTYLTVAASGAIKDAVPLSMVCLFQAEDITGTHTLLSIARSTGASHNFTLQASGATSGDPVSAISSAASAKTAVSGTGFVANKWCYGAAVFSAAAARAAYILSENSRNTAYKNTVNWGDKGTETSSSTPASLDYTYIGCTHDSSSTTNFLDGTIGACAIYSIALTDKQVMEIGLAMWDLVLMADR